MSATNVPLVVTQISSADPVQQSQDVPPRPHSLNFLTPEQELNNASGSVDPGGLEAGFNRERRGSKSCLKVHTAATDNIASAEPSGSRSPCLTASSPSRRRSVHFNASPVNDVHEVPASEADKAQRGCGALIGPAPFLMSGKEVYVAPSPDTECSKAMKSIHVLTDDCQVQG